MTEIVIIIGMMIVSAVISVGVTVVGNMYYKKRFEKNLQGLKWIAIISAGVCMVSSSLFVWYDYDWMKIVRFVILIAMLIVIARTDYEQMIIPNAFLGWLMLTRTLLLAIEVVRYKDEFVMILLSALVGIIYGSLLFLIAKLLVPDSIGMGDVKLFGVIGYFLGSANIMPALIVSLLVALVVCVVKLLQHKMKIKDSFSFGPYIAIGSIVVIMLGM